MKPFLIKRYNAFKHAFNGLTISLKNEEHVKIHFVATICVIVAGIYFNINPTEWINISFCCGLVIAAELINSSIERMCDLITTDYHPQIKYIKDVSAGAVLILSISAIVIGVLIFGKYIVQIEH